MWLHWSQQNEAQKQTKNFYIKFTFLTVQFNVLQKCYEFKPNTELLKPCKCYEHILYVISHEIVVWNFVWIFCWQKNWITQASNLEITKIMAT